MKLESFKLNVDYAKSNQNPKYLFNVQMRGNFGGFKISAHFLFK